MTRFPYRAALTAALFAIAGGSALAEPTATLTINLEGIETTTGSIRLGIYDEAGYASGAAVTGATIAATDTEVTATVSGLEPGTYGIKLYHDVDDDEEMDTNPFGMPTEPYAFSNNAQGQFGPAKWAAAKFEVTAEGAVQTITLN